jgi:hypothetical protein
MQIYLILEGLLVDSRCRIFTTILVWRGSALYSACDMLCLSDRTGKGSNIYIDILLIILNHYLSAWGLVGDVQERKGPI